MLIPDGSFDFATAEARIAEVFGLRPTTAVGLLPRPGECLDLHTCHEPALPGGDYCAKHMPLMWRPSTPDIRPAVTL